MNRKYIILASIIILFGIIPGQHKHNSSENNVQIRTILSDEIFHDGELDIYTFKQFEMTIVSIHGDIDFIYEPFNAKPFGELAKESNFRFAINATYFAGSNVHATHCGWLKMYGNKIISKKMNDPQIKYISQYNKQTKKIYFFYYKDFITTDDSNSLEFQTGPMVVESDSLSMQSIASSINGMRKAPRTLLASTDHKNIYFITVRTSVQLQEIGNFLRSLLIFDKKKLDVINLDGGPSTALYSKNNPEINFNTKPQLPFLLGVQ